jgi:hypothetical protein
MAIGYVTTLRSTRMTALVTDIDSGAGAGTLTIYSGSRPATGGTETTVLAVLTLSDPCGSVTNGVLTFSSITADSSANATGTATWARLKDSDGNAAADMSVGTSGADINFDSVSFVAGGNVAVTSLTITEGNA